VPADELLETDGVPVPDEARSHLGVEHRSRSEADRAVKDLEVRPAAVDQEGHPGERLPQRGEVQLGEGVDQPGRAVIGSKLEKHQPRVVVPLGVELRVDRNPARAANGLEDRLERSVAADHFYTVEDRESILRPMARGGTPEDLSPRPAPPYRRSASWEDPAILDLLGLVEGARGLVFEASGDDALMLAARGLGVVACLEERGARARVALALAAARALPVQSVRSLWGLGHFGRRIWFYHHLRPNLAPEAREWWDTREGVIRHGLAESGEVELAAARLRRLLGAPVGGRLAVAVLAPGLARLAGAPVRGAAAHLQARLGGGGPFAAWLRGLPAAELPRPWITVDGLRNLGRQPPELRGVSRAEAFSRGSEAFDAILLGRSPLSPDEARALPARLAPGGLALGWGDPPATLVLDANLTAQVRRVDQGLFPGLPWVARR
jgi:hypothetical protein